MNKQNTILSMVGVTIVTILFLKYGGKKSSSCGCGK